MSTSDDAAATLRFPAGEMQMVQSQETRKHTTVLRISTQLYSHRKKITFHGGGEKFKRNHDDRGKKREV